MMDEIIINRELLKAIGAESRISILKSLASGRKTQTQLAEELKLSSPTILEHLDQLVSASLVKKIDEGRKWKYYSLTEKGKMLIVPKQGIPARALLMLGSGLLLLLYSGMSLFTSSGVAPEQFAEAAKSSPSNVMVGAAANEPILNETARQVASAPAFDLNGLFIQFLLVAGIVMFCYGIYLIIKRKD
ncbi:MAG: winged helix-turn-helix domain-containing protein [Candidatus Micrarchaeota archaeon]|nr:winged helix-turn-helix domain-containing protein [Candidatus Micrarchaeota archaeon]